MAKLLAADSIAMNDEGTAALFCCGIETVGDQEHGDKYDTQSTTLGKAVIWIGNIWTRLA